MGRFNLEVLKPSDPALTTSTSRTETVNGSHEFMIAGYSLSKGIGIGKYVASDTFMVGGYDWAIYFYPDGKSAEDNSTYVSLFIALASEGTDVRALFELTLLDQSGRERHKVHSHFSRALESGPYTLKYRGSMWWVFFPISRVWFISIGLIVLFNTFDCVVLLMLVETVRIGVRQSKLLLCLYGYLHRCWCYEVVGGLISTFSPYFGVSICFLVKGLALEENAEHVSSH